MKPFQTAGVWFVGIILVGCAILPASAVPPGADEADEFCLLLLEFQGNCRLQGRPPRPGDLCWLVDEFLKSPESPCNSPIKAAIGPPNPCTPEDNEGNLAISCDGIGYTSGGGSEPPACDPPPGGGPSRVNLTTKRVPSRSTVDPLEQLVWPITPTIHLHTGTTNWTTDPLVLSSGELFFGAEDLSWAINGMALHLHRTYRDIDTGIPEDPDFGPSFYSSLNIRVDPVLDEGELDYVEVVLGNGEDIDFDCCTNGTDFTAESMWGGYTLEYVDVGQQTCEGQYVMTDKSGGQYTFSCTNSLLESASLVSVRDRYDQGFDYSYDGANLLTKISWSTDAQLAIISVRAKLAELVGQGTIDTR